MLFKRRIKPKLSERVRIALWPRRTWGRSWRYIIKRVLRLSASPHAIAAGFAGGAFASITPFVGLHFILGFAIAYVTGGNLVASALGTAIGNPITFPFIWAGTHRVGSWILGENTPAEPPIDISEGVFEHSLDALIPVIKPMVVGAIPIGIVIWFLCYIVVRTLVRSYQEARRKRFERVRAKMAADTNPGE